MKHVYKLLTVALCLFAVSRAQAQTYVSDTTTAQYMSAYNQSFTFSFTGLPAGGWGNGTLVVYFQGDFGDTGEFAAAVDEDGTAIGQAGPYASQSDCSPIDSAYLTFNAGQIDTWLADSQVDFTLTLSGNVDLGVCTGNAMLQCRLIYNYCAAGTPQEFASFNLTDSVFCTYDGAMALTGTPANGTFSGPGVTNNVFNPIGLTPGSAYMILYTATDGIGCTTTYSKKVKILRAPSAMDTLTCPGTDAVLTVPGGGTYVWFYDDQLTQVIDSGNVVNANPISQTTNYYVASLNTTATFAVDSISVLDSMVVDHNTTTGDDRGGIAITPNYIYVVGDNNTVRANASDLTGQVSLPIRDAIFSDLANGQLYTLWSTVENSDPNYNTPNVLVDAIRPMDADLVIGSETYMIDQPFMVQYGSTILTGNGFVAVRSGVDNHVYVIDLDNFAVEDLGVHSFNNYTAENWSNWGVLEYDGIDFYALYRSNSGSMIVRHNLTNDNITTVVNFPNGISDLASFTVSPWNDRWYFHYEGGSTTFGGSTETMGYAAAGSNGIVIQNNELGCYTEVEVFVDQIDLGMDTTVCEYNTPFVLFAGLGYNAYSWNGVNNNYNAFPVSESGMYVVEAIDDYNCSIMDTINVTVDPCLGLAENTTDMSMTLFPNPVNNKATLAIASAVNTRAEMSICDVNGKVLSSETVQITDGNNTITFDASAFEAGVYLIRLESEAGTQLIRFVKN